MNRVFFFFLLFISSSVYGQSEGAFGGSGNGEQSKAKDVPEFILKSIDAFLDVRGVQRVNDVVPIGERYLTMVPLKMEDDVHLVWADFLFDKNGGSVLVVTKVSDIEYAECSVLGTKICDGIMKFSESFKERFGKEYLDFIYVYEKKAVSYIEVFHPEKDEEKIRYDMQGNVMENE